MMPIDNDPVSVALTGQPAIRIEDSPELAELRAEWPDYNIWAEQPLGAEGPVKFVAVRRPGTSVSPYSAETHDLDELRRVLA